MKPLVSVICISYNHLLFLGEALHSLFAQDYPNLEIIVLDDASKDDSQSLISEVLASRSEIRFIPHSKNIGYTKTFNEGLKLATGEYIVDFSLDDVMLPGFISKSVERLESLGDEYGVSFCNANFINQKSEIIGNHALALFKKGMISEVPQGDIFEMVLKRYFICTPTMVMKKVVFDRIGGYDEGLSYEDFDFWVRSSRYFKYSYINDVLMHKRKLKTSMSALRYRHHENQEMNSVFKVCQKAFSLCKTENELKALRLRLNYEHRQCIRIEAYKLAQKYLQLIRVSGGNTLKAKMIAILIKFGFDRPRVVSPK